MKLEHKTEKRGRPKGPEKEKVTVYIVKGTRKQAQKTAKRFGKKESELYTAAIEDYAKGW